MRLLYTLLFTLLAPFYLARLYWRGLRMPAYRERWPERFGIFAGSGRRDGIWVHAVSVGEVLAIAQLVRRLLERYPGLPMLITTRRCLATRWSIAMLPSTFPGWLAASWGPIGPACWCWWRRRSGRT